MTENKRYFKREWEEEYYIFDSQTISEKEFDEKVEYEDYQAFADSMHGDDVVNRLNWLSDDNEHLNKNNLHLHHELRLKNDKIIELEKENEQLKKELSDIDGQLLMLDNCDNWDYDRMKHTVREIAEIIGYNGTINPKR